MSGFGLVARCDGGGLAACTREIHRHLHPTRTLLLDLEERGRGDCIPDEYTHGTIFRTGFKGAVADAAIDWMTAPGIDRLLSIETFYDDRLTLFAHRQSIQTVVYAMPELSPWFVDGDRSVKPRQLFVPTWWRLDTLPNAQLLPFPVARDRLPFTQRKRVAHLYHPTGVAMKDRNGTDLLLQALPFIESDVRLTIRSNRPVDIPADTAIDVEVHSDPSVDYWDVYPPEADLLVLPRRYGGLSLPVIECASLGIPAVMLASDPYAQESFTYCVPSTGSHDERMKGGRIPVHSADPRSLAKAIDWITEHPESLAEASRAADVWATEHSWDGPLGERWAQILGADDRSDR